MFARLNRPPVLALQLWFWTLDCKTFWPRISKHPQSAIFASALLTGKLGPRNTHTTINNATAFYMSFKAGDCLCQHTFPNSNANPADLLTVPLGFEGFCCVMPLKQKQNFHPDNVFNMLSQHPIQAKCTTTFHDVSCFLPVTAKGLACWTAQCGCCLHCWLEKCTEMRSDAHSLCLLTVCTPSSCWCTGAYWFLRWCSWQAWRMPSQTLKRHALSSTESPTTTHIFLPLLQRTPQT